MTIAAHASRRSARQTVSVPLILAGSGVATLLLSAGTIAIAGWILWSTAGTSVIDGTVAGQVGFLAVLITGVTSQSLLTERLRDAAKIGGRGFILATAAARAVIPVTLFAAAGAADSYYLAWLATLATFTLLVTAIAQLLTAAVGPSSDNAGRSRHPLILGLTGLVTLGVATAALLATDTVHNWSATMINGLLLLTGVGTLIGYATSAILARTWHK